MVGSRSCASHKILVLAPITAHCSLFNIGAILLRPDKYNILTRKSNSQSRAKSLTVSEHCEICLNASSLNIFQFYFSGCCVKIHPKVVTLDENLWQDFWLPMLLAYLQYKNWVLIFKSVKNAQEIKQCTQIILFNTHKEML